MRGLTQIRGAGHQFPPVAQLRALAAEVRSLMGPDTKISYAADWSEYFGYQPNDGSNNRYFHLDPLWADDNIDFIGIDNYMPLSDWRDGDEHADASWGSIYDIDYLRANIEGGEGYDWYYKSQQARDAQRRSPIRDEGWGEDWVYRYKDLRGWWLNSHHDRIDGVRQSVPTAWRPQSKPIWFTELGCAAIDKGTNQPNKFLDPKSSESRIPWYSNGMRDDLMQVQYLSALLGYWRQDGVMPVSDVYHGPMIDMDNAYVWAWDARPFPRFPNNRALWSDGGNYARGHWVNGRAGGRTLASVVAEICERSGVQHYDVNALYGFVRGFVVPDISDGRAALQPLQLRFGFDAIERDGVLVFRMRSGADEFLVPDTQIVDGSEIEGGLEKSRDPDAELSGRVRLRFVQADADHEAVAEEAILADDATHAVSSSELPLAMTRGEGRQVAERWLSESRVSRDRARIALPPSLFELGAGDVVRLPDGGGRYRIDRVEQGQVQMIEAVAIEPEVYTPSDIVEDAARARAFVAPVPVTALFMDLPLLTGDEVPHAPHLAVTGVPWPGSVALYRSAMDGDYTLSEIIASRATVGISQTGLSAAASGVWDRGPALQVKMISGALEARSANAVLNGANLAAIGDGTPGNWQVFQYQEAEIVAPNTYALTRRLRGQLGSDGVMPPVWPIGSWVVMLNGLPEQIDLKAAERALDLHFRIGPARVGYDDPSYRYHLHRFDGIGLRPYAPCHLRVSREGTGQLAASWIRRTRIDGDLWELDDVPLGEDTERYRLRILRGGTVVFEAVLDQPKWTCSVSQQAALGVMAGDEVEVAQISARFGPGLPARARVPG